MQSALGNIHTIFGTLNHHEFILLFHNNVVGTSVPLGLLGITKVGYKGQCKCF